MKSFIICFILFTFSTQTAFSQNSKCYECKQLLDTTISIMKENAVNRKKVNWRKVSAEVNKLIKKVNNPYELAPVFNYLFKKINDFHGAFFYGDSTFKWTYNITPANDSIQQQLKKGKNIKTRIVEGKFGYLRIPSMPVFFKEGFNIRAQRLNDSLCCLLNKNMKGLIIDLRLNDCSAMQPMLLGVQQLFKKGKIGSFDTDKKEDWLMKENKFFIDTVPFARIFPICNTEFPDMPVVIITSPVTGSAAEAFIIAFKGRQNTMLVGTTTAGYVTAYTGFRINKNAGLNLSIGYNTDLTGKTHKKALSPDVVINDPDNFSNIEKDAKIISALNWLKQKAKQHP